MDETEPFEVVQKKANDGDAEAQNTMGRRVSEAGGAGARAEAERWFRRAAEQGLAKAKHNLGLLYWRDDPTSREAMEWFGDAAADGWLESIFVLGAILEGRGDSETARRLYLTAAQRGHARSQDAMSRIHFERDNAEDHELARNWAEAAAEQGIPDAFTRLGTIFHEGLGTARDPQRAAGYFLEGAKRGHAGGQAMIGAALQIGAGVAPDRIEAAHWLMRSAAQGNMIGRAYLPEVMKELQQHEVDEATRRAREPLPPPTPSVT